MSHSAIHMRHQLGDSDVASEDEEGEEDEEQDEDEDEDEEEEEDEEELDNEEDSEVYEDEDESGSEMSNCKVGHIPGHACPPIILCPLRLPHGPSLPFALPLARRV